MMLRRVLMLAGVTVALLAVLLALVWVFQRRLIYMPFDEVPAAANAVASGVGIEEVRFSTADGLELDAWFLFPSSGAGSPGDSDANRATVLLFHGNAGNRAGRLPLAQRFVRHGLNVLLTDYRGYGGNPGRPTEPGLIADARAARTFLATRPEVDPQRIVYFGESLGTGVAVALAAEVPPAALVLRSPFSSLLDTARTHYPLLPSRWLLSDRFMSVERIRRVQVPLLVVAGSRDRVVPIELSRRLFEAAPMEAKRWLEMPGLDHNDYELAAGDSMVAAAVEWIDAATREPSPD